ncbi:MAG: hypothetical protein JWM44_503 [Bacilli bacterium]|nr:hypothetical protein [Bacilli bacterium]
MKNIIFYIALVIVVFSVLSMFNWDGPSKIELKNAPTFAPPEIEKKPTEVIPIAKSVHDFTVSFNKAAKDFGTAYVMKDVKVDDEGVRKAFNFNFDKYLTLIGLVNTADNSLSSVDFIGSGDDAAKLGSEIIPMVSILIQTTNPDLQAEDRLKILKELGLSADADPNNIQGEAVKNNIKYSASSDPTVGLMFSITNANH